MPTITATAEIAAPPAVVREVFLSFKTYPDWAKTHLQSIVPADAKDPAQLAKGDKVDVTLASTSFSAVVEENNENEFKWFGSVPLIFNGAHAFRFEPSKSMPGGTTFVNEEVFGGLLSFLVAPGWSLGEKTRTGFAAFAGEVKARVEGENSS